MTTSYDRKINRQILVPSKITLSPPRRSNSKKRRVAFGSSEDDLHAVDAGEIRRIKQNILEGVEQQKVHKVRFRMSRLKEIEKPKPPMEKIAQQKESISNLEMTTRTQDVKAPAPNISAKDDAHEANANATQLGNGRTSNPDTKTIPAPSTTINEAPQEVIIESMSSKMNVRSENETDDHGNDRALNIANLIHRFRNAPPTNRSERRKQTLQEIDDMLLSSPCNLQQKTATDDATKTEKVLSSLEIEEAPQSIVSQNDSEVGSSDLAEQTEEAVVEPVAEENEEGTGGLVKPEYATNMMEKEDNEVHDESIVTEKEEFVHRWYYIDHNQEDSKNGPFTTKEMFEFIGNGVLEPLSPVWCRGLPQWIPLKSVPVLMAKFRKSIGSLGRVSQVFLECPPSPSKPQRPTPPPTKRPYKQSIKTLNTSIDLKNHTRMLEQDIEDENELLQLAIRSKGKNDDSSGSSDNEESNVSSPEAAVLNSEWYQRHVQTVLSEVLSPSDGDKAAADIDQETESIENEAENLIDAKEEVASNGGDLIATIGINTDAVHFESRGTDVMNVSISTQVETSNDYGKSMIHTFPSDTIPMPSTSLVDLVSGGGTNKSFNKAALENPITESLDMLQSLISRVTKEKNILHQKKHNVFYRGDTTFLRDYDGVTSSQKKNTNDVNDLIKSLISTVETERKRISSLRLEV